MQNIVLLAFLIAQLLKCFYREQTSLQAMCHVVKRNLSLKNAHPCLHSLYPETVEFSGLFFPISTQNYALFLQCSHISRHSFTLFILTRMLKILLLSNWMLHIGTPIFSDESDRRKIGTSRAFWFFFFNLTLQWKERMMGSVKEKSQKTEKKLFWTSRKITVKGILKEEYIWFIEMDGKALETNPKNKWEFCM